MRDRYSTLPACGAWRLLALTIWLAIVCVSPSAGQTEPYREFKYDGSSFHGARTEEKAPSGLTSVRIGFTGPAGSGDGNDILHAARIAIDEANARGGYKGLPFEVVYRPSDGPWGVAARQVVRLSYEDEVWAVLGILDGAHAHLAELVAAKAWIPVVTPSAADRTIDYANVPWVFRCMPDDGRQARCLMRYAAEQEYGRIVALIAAERDARIGWERLVEAAGEESLAFALHLGYDPIDPAAVLEHLPDRRFDAFVIWGEPGPALRLLNALRRSGRSEAVLGPSVLGVPSLANGAAGGGDVVIAAPFDLGRDGPSRRAFSRRFEEVAGRTSTFSDVFTYDATRLVLDSIGRAGLDRVRIREELATASHDGLTGPIRFDGLGGNPATPVPMILKAGKWICLETRLE